MSYIQGEASIRHPFIGARMEVGAIKINLKAVNSLLILLLAITMLYYLAGVIGRSDQGFELRDLKRRASELITENTQLEARANTLKSMSSLKEKMQKLDMVAASEVNYLGSGTAPVAQR